MKQISFTIFLISITFYFMSCSNKVTSTVQGWWTIDTIRFGNYGDIRGCVSSIIIFKGDGSCSLQATNNYCEGIETYEEKGEWKISYTDTVPVLINIKTGNRIFKGVHEVYFWRDDKEGLLKMAWVSDSLYMICRKGMYDIDLHKKEVDYLTELTNKEWEKERK